MDIGEKYKTCPKCHEVNIVMAKYCSKCGQSLEKIPEEIYVQDAGIKLEKNLYISAGAIPEQFMYVGSVYANCPLSKKDDAAAWLKLIERFEVLCQLRELAGVANLRMNIRKVGDATEMFGYGDGIIKQNVLK